MGPSIKFVSAIIDAIFNNRHCHAKVRIDIDPPVEADLVNPVLPGVSLEIEAEVASKTVKITSDKPEGHSMLYLYIVY